SSSPSPPRSSSSKKRSTPKRANSPEFTEEEISPEAAAAMAEVANRLAQFYPQYDRADLLDFANLEYQKRLLRDTMSRIYDPKEEQDNYVSLNLRLLALQDLGGGDKLPECGPNQFVLIRYTMQVPCFEMCTRGQQAGETEAVDEDILSLSKAIYDHLLE